jgi:hypothetical protein
MSSRSSRLYLVTAFLLLAALGGWFFAAYRQRASEAERATLAALAASLHTALKENEAELAAGTTRQAELNASLATLEKKPVPLPARIQPNPPGLIEMSRDHPGLWNAFIASQVAAANKRYGPLFLSLRLTPAQIEKFRAIQAAYGARGADIAAAGDTQNLSFEDPALVALRKQSEDQLAADRLALLGDAGYRQFQEYERTMPARGLAHGLATALAFSDPLSAQQAEQLTLALAQASPAYATGGAAQLSDIDWTAVDRSARTFLSPMQYAVWIRGDAHDPVSGSRSSIQLQTVYDRAVEQEKVRGAAAGSPAPSPAK